MDGYDFAIFVFLWQIAQFGQVCRVFLVLKPFFGMVAANTCGIG
jgi:hypothetical protein